MPQGTAEKNATRQRKRKPSMLGPFQRAVRDFEREFLKEAIVRHGGNLSHVAVELELTVSVIRYHVFEHDLLDFVSLARSYTKEKTE